MLVYDWHANTIDMSLPRLKKGKQAEAKLSRGGSPSATKASSSPTAEAALQDGSNGAPTSGALSREADILSLLTVLNAPVINGELPATLQAVKAALYARDYMTAFSRPVSAC